MITTRVGHHGTMRTLQGLGPGVARHAAASRTSSPVISSAPWNDVAGGQQAQLQLTANLG